jgi:hypothetical protein
MPGHQPRLGSRPDFQTPHIASLGADWTRQRSAVSKYLVTICLSLIYNENTAVRLLGHLREDTDLSLHHRRSHPQGLPFSLLRSDMYHGILTWSRRGKPRACVVQATAEPSHAQLRSPIGTMHLDEHLVVSSQSTDSVGRICLQ